MRRLSIALLAGMVCGSLAVAGPIQKKKVAPKRAPAAPRVQIKPDEINMPTQVTVGPESKGSAVIRAQILLAQNHFSPGEIELAYNDNLKAAVMVFQTANGLPSTGIVDAETWRMLEGEPPVPEPASYLTGKQDPAQGLDDAAARRGTASADGPLPPEGEGAAVLATYIITREDTAGPFVRMPRARNAEELMLRKAQLPRLGYASLLEKLGEKFHISPKLLVQLNPRKNFARVGTEILVPRLPLPLKEKANVVIVDASEHGVTALSAEGRIIAFYPATMGSEHDPLPIGNWKINGVSPLPKFHYDPRLFWDAKNKNAKAILPPGPNSPVGTVWIDLSKEHYGIHGTPEPSLIGKSESHGCIRLTNWDAEELSKMVAPGVAAILQE